MTLSSRAPRRSHRATSWVCRAALAISIASVGLGAATAAHAQSGPYYPMICRGGGDLMMSVSQLSDGQNTIELMFEKGVSAYRPDTLRPGQCTWPDRALNRSEPARIMHITPARLSLYVWASQFNTIGTPVRDSRTGWPVVLTRRFMALARGTGVFTVWARNSRAGYFEISNARAGD